MWHVTGLIHMWHCYMGDSLTWLMWLSHMTHMTCLESWVRHDSYEMTYTYVTRDRIYSYVTLLYGCAVTLSCARNLGKLGAPWRLVRHGSFLCVTWLVPTRDMTHSYVWHYMTYLHVCHDSFTHVRKTGKPGTPWLIHTRDVTQFHSHTTHSRSHVWRD